MNDTIPCPTCGLSALTQCAGYLEAREEAAYLAASQICELKAELETRRMELAKALGWTSDASWNSMTHAVREGLEQNRRLLARNDGGS